MTGFIPKGLINLIGTKDFKIISRDQAILICNKEKIKKPGKEFKNGVGMV